MESRYRILAVDDEPEILRVLRRTLEEEYEVLTATSGAEALELIRSTPDIHVLITDQRMPEMSGIKLIEQAKKTNPAMVRIILTGYTEPKDLIDAINRGEVYRYITKPWELNDLLLTIRNGLEAFQLRQDKERLLRDLEKRLNAFTVFLDLSKEAARVGSYQELIQALIKYLPYIVDFDACAALLEHEAGARALLNIHRRKPLHANRLYDIRQKILQAYARQSGHAISEQLLMLQVTGETDAESAQDIPFRSGVDVLLRSGGLPVGLVQIHSFREDAFREDTHELLDILANHASEIIQGLRQQLSIEQQRLRLMVQSLPDGVIMVDDKDQVFVINPAARQLLHLSPDAKVDTRYLKETLGFYPFDLVRGLAARDNAIIREEIQVFDRILHSIVSPVLMSNKLLGVAVVLRDITEDKLLEERKEEFVSIVSHELRTPLTSIGGALDLLLHRYAGDINPKQERYLGLAKESCNKLNVIIDDLLDLNRFAKGKLEMHLGQVDLAALVKDAVDQYLAAAQEREVDLSLDMEMSSAKVMADRNRLHQVLNNLLSNALKFTQDGGQVRVRVFGSSAMESLVGVSVFNDGEEIDEQDHERIFDKFEQARRSRAGVSGSGLGLSISKSIIEAHRGMIWVESGRGKGTEFIFTLPLQQSTEVAEALPAPTSSSQVRFKSPPRILIVDDDVNTTYVIKGLLISQGYHVLVAHNGEDALSLARERNPDLIIMDIRMPERDGLQITDILHHDPETREIPVLVASILDSEEEAFKSGASAYLAKPFGLNELRERVLDLLEKRNLVTRLFHVLIVDDDPAIRSICRDVLDRQGYAVREASSGSEAIEMLNRNPVDIVLLDVMLPDFDGFQVTEQIRRNRKMADVPIIFISARGQTSDKVRALKLGGDDYMVKPFDTLELGARVDAVLQRKERELDSSPTTKLPGSVAVERELNRRLASKKAFSLCYLDLDNLKAYNDYYGYAKADGVIQQTGDVIRKAVEKLGTQGDFVGHIAGDDFVIITEVNCLEPIAHEIIHNFDNIIPLYYHREDQARGYIETPDRFGELRRFKIMSISLAAVHVEPNQYRSHSEIAARAAELKQHAKTIDRSVLVMGVKEGEPVVK
ncbi:MAG: response regulator [Deltaproteobacteria bacterium]|nr:response regulator [Deltaproteobacteria bacterium]